MDVTTTAEAWAAGTDQERLDEAATGFAGFPVPPVTITPTVVGLCTIGIAVGVTVLVAG
ncbi:hypothetical protein AAH978_09930 [Streptomyces sp. ZYX-F-203]